MWRRRLSFIAVAGDVGGAVTVVRGTVAVVCAWLSHGASRAASDVAGGAVGVRGAEGCGGVAGCTAVVRGAEGLGDVAGGAAEVRGAEGREDVAGSAVGLDAAGGASPLRGTDVVGGAAAECGAGRTCAA